MRRVIIWTIVGIVVVVGVIFIVTSRRQAAQYTATKPLSDEAFGKYCNRMDHQVDRLNIRIARVKAQHANPSPEVKSMLDGLDAKMAEFVTAVGELKGKTQEAERDEGYTKTQEITQTIRRMIRDLGGATGGE